MPPAEPLTVAGAGVAGLVVARRLALAGRRVRVREAADRPGGQLAPLRIAGVDLDAGAESFATRGGVVAALAAELGLDVVTPRPGPAWVQRARGGAVPLPAAGLLGIPADLDAPDVARALGAAGLRRARHDAELPPTVGAEATTVGELVRARMGDAVLDTLVAPVTRGVYSAEADRLPLAVAAPTLLAALREHGSLAAAVRGLRAQAPAGSLVAGIRGGMFRLADALAADCARLGVTIETGAAAREADVWAAPRDDEPPRDAVTLVTVVVDAPALDAAPRGSGLLVAAGSGVVARAATHLSAKWDWVAEALGGRHAIRLSYDASPADPVATALADASTLFEVRLAEALDAAVRVWRRPGPALGATAGVRVGEPVAGAGLAAVVAQAEATASRLLAD